MSHEQLIAACFQWHWNEFPEERQMLYAVNNNISEAMLRFVPAQMRKAVAIQEGSKNKSKGVVAGVFDFCYILPRTVVWLDGKVGNDRISKEQSEFAQKCLDRGFVTFTFSSLKEFQEIIHKLQDTYYV